MKYSKEVQIFIKENVYGRTSEQLAELTNKNFGTYFNKDSMKSYKNNHRLKSGTMCGKPSGYSIMFTDEIVEFIKKNNYGKSANEITEEINKKFNTTFTPEQIKNYRARHGLISGINGRFKKGHISYNKGTKGLSKSNKTSFKKGNIPTNYRPVGSERVTIDGYVEIKVADPNKWKLKHRIIWEKEKGKIPEGNIIIFLDGNSLNLDINNLKCITKAQNARLNRLNLNGTGKDYIETSLIIVDMQEKYLKKAKELGMNTRKLRGA